MGETVSSEFNSNDTRVLLTCSPYFNVHGQILGVTMVVTEFPGLAREMELLLNNSMLFATHHALDGTLLRASESSAKLLGFSREEVLGKSIFDLYSPETAAQIQAIEADLIGNDRGVVQATYKVDREGGAPIWLSVDKIAYKHQGENKPTIYSVGVDISEVVKGKQNAETLVKQLTLLQDVAHVGFWSVDLESEELHWSREVFRIHGVDTNQPTPNLEDAINFYHPDDRDTVAKIVENSIDKGGEFRFEKRIIAVDGSEVPVESHGHAVQDETGRVTKIIGVFRDLSAQ